MAGKKRLKATPSKAGSGPPAKKPKLSSIETPKAKFSKKTSSRFDGGILAKKPSNFSKKTSLKSGSRTPFKSPNLSSPISKTTPKTFNKKAPSADIPVDLQEEAFPRGGKELLTPLEKSIISKQVNRDLLFQENEDEEESDVKRTEITKAKEKNDVKRIEILNTKKLVPGMLILGAVLEIHEYVAVLSLPFNMRGTVAISDISDHVTKLVESEAHRLDSDEEAQWCRFVRLVFKMSDLQAELFSQKLSQTVSCLSSVLSIKKDLEKSQIPLMERLFSVGQFLPCYVLAVHNSRISLSINPKLVNEHLSAKDIKPNLLLPGSVASVEDHGYIMDFGIEGKTGFLLKKNSSEFCKGQRKGKSLCVGQVVHCAVLASQDTRAVPVSVNPSQVGVAMMASDHSVRVGSLLPGLLVKAAVSGVASNGLFVTFLDGFAGTVAPQHFPSLHLQNPESFQVKKKLKARLLWVDVAVKKAGLTFQKQLVEGKVFDFEGLEIGTVFEAAKVVRVDYSSGLYLELSSTLIGYAPPWMITDDKVTSESVPIKERKKYQKGTIHEARVSQFNRIDGFPILSLQPSVLEKPYMRYSDVSVGDRVEGVVEKVCPFGLIVMVTETIRGLCPRIHVSDVKSIILKPSKKYKEGSKVRCRVINVNPAHKRLMLTCKKSLVRESESGPILSEYASAEPGGRYRGVITSVHSYGCIVHFFRNVRGLVRKAELGAGAKAMVDPSAIFWAGQVVDCRVVECEASTQRLLLSLVLDTPSEMEDGARVAMAAPHEEEMVKAGGLVDGEVTGIASNGITLKYQASPSDCSSGSEGERLFLPTFHLSDYPHHCSYLLSMHQTQLENALKEGRPYVLQDLLVVNSKLGYKPALVTLKKMMLKHVQEKGYVDVITDFKVGMVQAGFVRNVQNYGCFVDFPHQLTGLAHLKYLTDQFISSTSGVYQEGQTVLAKVLALEEDEGKLSLTLRPSDLKLSDTSSEDPQQTILASFRDYVSERTAILEALKLRSTVTGEDGLSSLAQAFVPGGRVSGHVSTVTEDSALVDLGSKVKGKINRASIHGGPLEEGVEVVCSILDMDLVECCLVLTRNSNIQSPPTPSASSAMPPPASPAPRRSERIKQKMKTTATTATAAVKEVGLSPGSSVVGMVEHKTPYYVVLSCSTLTGCRLVYGLMDTGQVGVLPLNFHHLRVGQQVTGSVLSWSSECGGLPVVMVTDVLSGNVLHSSAFAGSSHSSSHTPSQGDGKCSAKGNKRDRFSRTSSEVSGGKQGGRVGNMEISDLSKGELVKGYVKAITDVGVFVRLGRNLDGRVKITHLVDGFVKDFKSIYSVGELVTAKVLEVDGVKRQVELSLRLSQVDPEAAKKQRKSHGTHKEKGKKDKKKKEEATVLRSDGESSEAEAGDSEGLSGAESEESSASESEEEEEEEEFSAPLSRPSLTVGGGFRWEVGQGGGDSEAHTNSSEESDSEEMDVTEAPSKRSRRQKRAVKKAEEVQLYEKERSLLEAGKGPESAEDFDRLLLATPNRSALWVQYMAFYLHMAEVDKARGVAQRALRTISFRETSEKLNVWVGWMNLENLYGSEESLVKVFESALKENEPIEVYKRLAAIYVQSKKNDLAAKLYQTMIRKFSGVQWVWSQYATFLMKQGKLVQARALLQKALKSLVSKQDHISMISKFSQLEFKHGEASRGQTMFESLLSSYPKRVDLWSVYTDMLVKTGDVQKARTVFEQTVHLKLSAKKMQFMLKRYLAFEKEHGTKALADAVVDKARAYVDAQKASGAADNQKASAC